MTSIVWGRHPQEAYNNPYEYEAQEQFFREAKSLLDDFNIRLDQRTLYYHRDDQSLEKATWMLSLDLVDSLLECLDLLREKRHRPASRLFRDAVETMDFLKVIHSNTERGRLALEQWYLNRTIRHSECRAHLREIEGEETAKVRKAYYEELSKFTHRSYRALLHSFSLGRDNLLVHDSHSRGLLVLPQTIAAYLAILADLIVQASDCLKDTKAIPADGIDTAWFTSLEAETVPRRFAIQ
jgi:hypothetical protein